MGGDSSPIGSGNILSQINPQFSDSSLLAGCNYPTAHSLFSSAAPTPAANPTLLAHAAADPFWLQKLQTVMNMNLLLSSSPHHQSLQSAVSLHHASAAALSPATFSPATFSPATLSPPLKATFPNLAGNQLLSANQLLQSAAAAAVSAGLVTPSVNSSVTVSCASRTNSPVESNSSLMDNDRKKSIDKLRQKARQHAPTAGLDLSSSTHRPAVTATTTG